MDAPWIITAFVVIDTLLERLGHRSDVRAQVPDAEIVTIAVVAATYFASNHERAVQVMRGCGYLSGSISVSRFNRRLHALADWLTFIPTTLGDRLTTGEVFGIGWRHLMLKLIFSSMLAQSFCPCNCAARCGLCAKTMDNRCSHPSTDAMCKKMWSGRFRWRRCP